MLLKYFFYLFLKETSIIEFSAWSPFPYISIPTSVSFLMKKRSQQNKMPPLNHFATFCVKNVMGNAHIKGKVTILPEHLFHLVHGSSFYITVQALLMVFFLSLMWHLKDYGIFRKAHCSDFSGYLAESDTEI